MKTVFPFVLIVLLFLMSCGSGGDKDTSSGDQKSASTVDKPNGEKIFRTYCITCHGIDGTLSLNGAKDLALSEISMDERILQITKGKNLMTPFEGILTEEQIKAVAQYTASFKEK